MGKYSKQDIKTLGKDKVVKQSGKDYIYTMMPSLKKALGK